jgi:hypothetical protein
MQTLSYLKDYVGKLQATYVLTVKIKQQFQTIFKGSNNSDASFFVK